MVLRNGESEHCGRRGLKNVRVSSANDYEEAMSPGYRRTVAHKSQWLWAACTRLVHAQVRQNHDKGDLARSHTPDNELVIDSCWKTESQFLLVS